MKLKLVLIFLLVVGGSAAVFVSLVGFPASAAGGTTYLSSAAAVGDVAAEIAATGTIETTATYSLAFGREGRLTTDDTGNASGATTTWPVAEVAVDVGDTVTAGDVLATADTTRLEQELASAVNSVRSANIQVAIAEETLEDADTTDERRQAKVNLYSARNQRTEARQARADLQAALKHPSLVAPVDGIVTAVAIAAGSDAPSADAITIVASAYQVTAGVVESDIGSIEIGQSATVTIDALGTDVPASVAAISPVAAGEDGSVVSYPVTIQIDEAPGDLRSGMTADVTITTASVSGVLAVPSAALSGTDGAYSVSVLDANGAVETRAVEVGLVTDSLAEVTGGLVAGERVVTGTTADLQAAATGNGGRGTFGGNVPIPGGGGPGGGGLGGGLRP